MTRPCKGFCFDIGRTTFPEFWDGGCTAVPTQPDKQRWPVSTPFVVWVVASEFGLSQHRTQGCSWPYPQAWAFFAGDRTCPNVVFFTLFYGCWHAALSRKADPTSSRLVSPRPSAATTTTTKTHQKSRIVSTRGAHTAPMSSSSTSTSSSPEIRGWNGAGEQDAVVQGYAYEGKGGGGRWRR